LPHRCVGSRVAPAVCAAAAPTPLGAVAVTVVALSLGYDMTQPPLAAIVTDLPGHRGQALDLNVFTLFTGFVLGALAFAAQPSTASPSG